MSHLYKTEGVCSREIEVWVEDGVLRDVRFDGGCNGNLKAVRKLVVGRPVDEVCELLSGITCGERSTSCADQLTRAIKAGIEHSADKAN